MLVAGMTISMLVNWKRTPNSQIVVKLAQKTTEAGKYHTFNLTPQPLQIMYINTMSG
jgi:hypothetical protein